ncbi:hypothetical protein CH63R_07968 [Colletotrichum higginsianum IMI 349063]|uniref:Uncharacterized protein n=1 Tax=Colletotrichum higginsianum (strain IMI 349063) TaxID=759273 RepID=A0A1B7YAS0_COLHI|nr:hypothetical protein CH63R_07968 [Colletotrichum higginsianum IMI 349063]OBR09203.1 hypothetical protein CH63R_07968 [Colletotrichum higginsianum IMI 349063]
MSLMQNPILIKLRDDAERHDEWATVKFWNHVLTKYVFTEDHFVVSTEQPPVPLGSLRRVDVVIESWSGSRFHLLLFLEAKKGRAGPVDIAEVEAQAYSACLEHFQENTTRGQIWAMTCFGPNARFWVFDSQWPYLAPYYPVEGEHGQKSTYIDFKYHESAIMDTLRHIKGNPVPPAQVFRRPLQGAESSETTLLSAESVTLVRVTKIRKTGPEIETFEGTKFKTVSARWSPAQCIVDGQVVDGYFYDGNSGAGYFTTNKIQG